MHPSVPYDFKNFSVEHCQADCEKALHAYQNWLDSPRLEQPLTWDNWIAPSMLFDQALGQPFAQLSHLDGVCSDTALRAAMEALLPQVSAFHSAMAQHKTLYQGVQALYQKMQAQPDDFTESQRVYLEKRIRDYRLSGMHLPIPQQEQLKTYAQELSLACHHFSKNVVDASDAFSLAVSWDDLKGLPDYALDFIRHTSTARQSTEAVVTLDPSLVQAIMRYAEKRDLRQKIHLAYGERASERTPDYDNSTGMMTILQLREKMAKLLDFEHYADVSLFNKMAANVATVRAFLDEIYQVAERAGQNELAILKTFAQQQGYECIQPWDVAYLSEKLKEQTFGFDDQTVRAYFPYPQALAGLMSLTQTLFGIHWVAVTQPLWHETAQRYDVYRGDHCLGHLYLDPFARPGKRPGAWMDPWNSYLNHPEQGIQRPCCAVVCNFMQAPQGPSLLSHDDLQTLFHEMGHALHHLLSTIEIPDIAGTQVAWDAVELPSQFMENFCWSYDLLRSLSSHAQTQEPLPEALFTDMLRAKHFQNGLFLLRQIEFGLFDMAIHTRSIQDPAEIQQCLSEVREKTALLPVAPENRFAHSFSHIFAGGYAAGYYSYLWANRLSADAFEVFAQAAKEDYPNLGKRFYESILSQGALKPMDVLYRAFKGSPAQTLSLLKEYGLDSYLQEKS